MEDSAQARALIRDNSEAMQRTGVARIVRRDATKLGPAGTMEPFALAFLDPPYGKGLAELGLAALVEGGWLVKNAIVVVEERAGTDIALPEAFAELDRRAYGDTQVLIARYQI